MNVLSEGAGEVVQVRARHAKISLGVEWKGGMFGQVRGRVSVGARALSCEAIVCPRDSGAGWNGAGKICGVDGEEVSVVDGSAADAAREDDEEFKHDPTGKEDEGDEGDVGTCGDLLSAQSRRDDASVKLDVATTTYGRPLQRRMHLLEGGGDGAKGRMRIEEAKDRKKRKSMMISRRRQLGCGRWKRRKKKEEEEEEKVE